MKILYPGFVAALALLMVTTPVRPQETSAAQKLVGRPMKTWVIPRGYWANTPRPIWLGGLRGKVVVIDFFRTECSYCQESCPARRELYKKYRGRGFAMIGFQSPGRYEDPQNPENDWPGVQKWVRDRGLTYPIAFDKDSRVFRNHGFELYPTAYVVDRKGIIVYAQTGFGEKKAKDLDAAVAKALVQS